MYGPFGPPGGGVFPPVGHVYPGINYTPGGDGGVARPTANDTRDETARFARGMAAPVKRSQVGLTLLAQHSSAQPRVVRAQVAQLADLPREVVLLVHVEHGIDSGVTMARAELPAWGVALQVPAGQINVKIEVRQRFDGVPIPEGEDLYVTTSIAAGYLRESEVCQSFDCSQVAPGPFPYTVQPPPFAVRAVVSALAGGGAKYTNTPPSTWSQTLDSNSVGAQYIEAKQAAQPFDIQGWTSGNGLFEVRWIVRE